MPGYSPEVAIAAANNLVAARKSTPNIHGVGELGVRYKVDNQPGNGGRSSAGNVSDVPSFVKNLTAFTPPTATKLTSQAPIERDPYHPNAMRNLQDFERIRRDRQRQKQEAEEQVRSEQLRVEQQRLAHEREVQAQNEQRKRDEKNRAEEMCDRLEKEMRSTPIPQLAKYIKQEWQRNSSNIPITLTAVRETER